VFGELHLELGFAQRLLHRPLPDAIKPGRSGNINMWGRFDSYSACYICIANGLLAAEGGAGKSVWRRYEQMISPELRDLLKRPDQNSPNPSSIFFARHVLDISKTEGAPSIIGENCLSR
jgi:hypothetical protein